MPVPPGRGRRRRRRWKLAAYLGLLAVLARTFDAALVARRARRGPWRAEVAERSMAPALLPGDWLLLDPTARRWPRPGTIVVVREPGTGILAIKRVAARGGWVGAPTSPPGGPGGVPAPPRGVPAPPGGVPAPPGGVPAPPRGVPAPPRGVPAPPGGGPGGAPTPPPGLPERPLGPREAWVLGDAPEGSLDSRTYGPLDADDLVARAWFRYGPPGRVGRLR